MHYRFGGLEGGQAGSSERGPPGRACSSCIRRYLNVWVELKREFPVSSLDLRVVGPEMTRSERKTAIHLQLVVQLTNGRSTETQIGSEQSKLPGA